MKNSATVLAITAVLTACSAPPKPMDRAEYLAATTRTYPGATKEQIIAAATTVLSLADPGNFATAHNDDGFTATHTAVGFGSRDIDAWEFKVRDSAGGPRASIQVNSSLLTAGLAPTTTMGTYSVSSTTSPSTMVPGDSLYDLFFARMDYMLFKRDTWTTCDEHDLKAQAGKVSGPTDALCRRGTPDDVPGKPRVSKLPAKATGPYEQRAAPVVIAPDRKR